MPEVKLAMALRFLAGGSPLDLKLIYHVSTSFVYDSIWLVVDAVNKKLKMELPLDDTDKLATLEAEWRARARCPDWVESETKMRRENACVRTAGSELHAA